MDGQSDQSVTCELRDGIALIGLNRPTKRNATSDRVVEALHPAIEQAQLGAKATTSVPGSTWPSMCKSG